MKFLSQIFLNFNNINDVKVNQEIKINKICQQFSTISKATIVDVKAEGKCPFIFIKPN